MKTSNSDSDRIRLHSSLFRPLKAIKDRATEHRPHSDTVVPTEAAERSPVFWKGSLWKSLRFFEVLPSSGSECKSVSASIASLLNADEIAVLPPLEDSLKLLEVDDKAEDFSPNDAKKLREALALLGGEFFLIANEDGGLKTIYRLANDPDPTLIRAVRSAFASGLPRQIEAVKVVLELGLIHPDDRNYEHEEFLLEQVLTQKITSDIAQRWTNAPPNIASEGGSTQSSSLIAISDPLKESIVQDAILPISRKEQVQILLEYGADPGNFSLDGKSMWKLAVESDIGEDVATIIAMMLDMGYQRITDKKCPVEEKAAVLGWMLCCLEHLPDDSREKWYQDLMPRFEKVHAKLIKAMATNSIYQFDRKKLMQSLMQDINSLKESLAEPVPVHWLKQCAAAYIELKDKEKPLASPLLNMLEDAKKLYSDVAYKKYVVDNYMWFKAGDPQDFYGSYISKLESWVSGQSNELHLHKLKVFPDFIFHLDRLDHLTALWLTGNELKEVPIWVRKLKNLERLFLFGNKLNTIPTWLKELTNLKEIDLSYNPLKNFPQSIGAMPKLETLDLRYTGIATFPEFIRGLKNLRSLYFSGCKLEKVPVWINELTELRLLNLSGNKLTSFPELSVALSKLEYLILSGNLLTSIPDSICKMINLKSLDILNNRVTTLPQGICKLTNLKSLNILNNRVTTLPQGIQEMRLSYLNAYGNPLTRETIAMLQSMNDSRAREDSRARVCVFDVR